MTNVPFNKEAARAVDLTNMVAARLESTHRRSEHFLLSFLRAGSGYAYEVLMGLNLSYDDLYEYIRLTTTSDSDTVDHLRPFSPNAQRLLDGAQEQATRYKSSEVKTEHMLLAMLLGDDSTARDVLCSFKVQPQALGDTMRDDMLARNLTQANFARLALVSHLEQALAACDDPVRQRQITKAFDSARRTDMAIERICNTRSPDRG